MKTKRFNLYDYAPEESASDEEIEDWETEDDEDYNSTEDWGSNEETDND